MKQIGNNPSGAEVGSLFPRPALDFHPSQLPGLLFHIDATQVGGVHIDRGMSIQELGKIVEVKGGHVYFADVVPHLSGDGEAGFLRPG